MEGFLLLTACAIHSTAAQNIPLHVQEQMIANLYADFFFFYMYVCFTYTLKNQFKNTAVNYLPQRSIKKASC